MSSIRRIRLPLTDDQLAPLTPAETSVAINNLPTDHELERIAALVETGRNVGLTVAGSRDSFRDLEFLRFFPSVRSVSIDVWRSLESFDGLRHLSENLEWLSLLPTRRRLSIRAIERFVRLRGLYLDGNQPDLDAIGGLHSLEAITLRSVTLPSLSPLLPLDRLRSFDLKLGGTSDLGLLPHVGKLEYIELWQVRGLADVSVLAQIPTLRHVFLQSLKNVTALPSFERATALRRFDFATMKGLTDLAPLARAPGLEILGLVDFRHADPSILQPFVGHPTLRAGIWGFGSDRKNFAAQALLPLPPEPDGYGLARFGTATRVQALPWNQRGWTGYRRAETEIR